MIPVIVISLEEHPAVLDPLACALGGRERVTVETHGELISGGGDYFISVRRNMPRLHSRGVVLLCSWQSGRLSLPDQIRAVALSSDRRARRVLQRSRCETLCCGMALSDSLTLSSLRDDSAVISLQRELTDLRGETLEPFELPVQLSTPLEPPELLLASAAAILCGEMPKHL